MDHGSSYDEEFPPLPRVQITSLTKTSCIKKYTKNSTPKNNAEKPISRMVKCTELFDSFPLEIWIQIIAEVGLVYLRTTVAHRYRLEKLRDKLRYCHWCWSETHAPKRWSRFCTKHSRPTITSIPSWLNIPSLANMWWSIQVDLSFDRSTINNLLMDQKSWLLWPSSARAKSYFMSGELYH